ncbi:MAG: hypothetical protein FJX89_01450 [Bacteroidetes bacterium]|nr:hypothetical protein [Bacteroidota bacterium]
MQYRIKHIPALMLMVSMIFSSCRKEELNPVATPEPGVWGQGKLLSGQFTAGNDANSKVSMQLKWIDVNRKVTITKMEVFITMTEKYTDKNGNPATADHGSKSYKVFDAKGNNEAVLFDITANEVYALFQTAKFNYGKGAGNQDVFSTATGRTAGKRFTKNDSFKMEWALTSKDGLVYKWWSVSVVNGELYTNQPEIAANTNVTWTVK